MFSRAVAQFSGSGPVEHVGDTVGSGVGWMVGSIGEDDRGAIGAGDGGNDVGVLVIGAVDVNSVGVDVGAKVHALQWPRHTAAT